MVQAPGLAPDDADQRISSRSTMSLREQDRRQRQRQSFNPIVVYPFREWCAMRGISVATGRRLAAAGRVKVTHLSERIIGVRSNHDQEYLDSCA
jgi:hypothetical protein